MTIQDVPVISGFNRAVLPLTSGYEAIQAQLLVSLPESIQLVIPMRGAEFNVFEVT